MLYNVHRVEYGMVSSMAFRKCKIHDIIVCHVIGWDPIDIRNSLITLNKAPNNKYCFCIDCSQKKKKKIAQAYRETEGKKLGTSVKI